MEKNILEEIVQKAKREGRNVNIYAHKRPDGDAVASSKTLEKFLLDRGVTARYILTSPRVDNRFSSIVGMVTPFQDRVLKEDIAVILDTSTTEHLENNLYKYSRPENTYVIDHHKKDSRGTIEDVLKLPKQNVYRNQQATSTCEMLAGKMNELGGLNPEHATDLLVGVWTDTSKFRRFGPDTFDNLIMLLNAGGDYDKVRKTLDAKRYLKPQVGLAKALLHTKQIKLKNTYLNYLGLDNKTAKELEEKYSIRDIGKKVFRLMEVENTSMAVAIVESMPGQYFCEFRSSQDLGNVDVFSVASSMGGGGHYNASGCTVYGPSLDKVSRMVLTKVTNAGLPSLVGIKPQELSSTEIELGEVLDSMDRFNKNLNPEKFARIQELVNNGARYQSVYDDKMSFKKYMLRNELLSQVPDEQTEQSAISINLNKSFLDRMQSEYGASADEVLDEIELFKELKVDFVSIKAPEGKGRTMDSNGNIKSFTSEETIK